MIWLRVTDINILRRYTNHKCVDGKRDRDDEPLGFRHAQMVLDRSDYGVD